MNKIVNKLKTVPALINETVVTKQQEQLINTIKDAFCKEYKLNVKLYLTGDATYKKYNMKDYTLGFCVPSKGKVVVKVSNDVSETIETLMHELTHAYQYKYLRSMLQYGMKQQEVYGRCSNDDVYWNSVHEQHARLCGEELAKKILKNKNNIRRAIKSYNIEEALHRINYNVMAV